MNAAALSLDLPARADASVVVACFHCGEPTSILQRESGGNVEAFCCPGCAGAVQWIRDAQLGDYYQLRSQVGARVDSAPSDDSVWDRDDLLSGHVREYAGWREVTVITDGMRCAACAWLIDRAITRLPGVTEVSANAVTGRVRLRWNPELTALSALVTQLARLGYRSYLSTGLASDLARRQERNRALLRLGVAGLGAMQAMMFSEALFLDTAGQMPLPTRDFLRWVTFLVASPVVWYSGWPFLIGAWRELAQRRPGMDFLIAGSTLLAYFASLFETLRGGRHVWYDAAVMFVFLLLTARTLELRGRRLATAQVDALSRSRPALATRETADGQRERIPVSALRIDDVACVAAGEIAPADGVLLDEAGSFEESLLTGESTPAIKQRGDTVFAGTLCHVRPARVQVTEIGSATRLSQITRLVEAAQAHRPVASLLADRLASRLVWLLLFFAVATWLFWQRQDPSRAFEITLALLVISCPCALSLAVPASLAAAHGALARIGVLALKPDALSTLADCTDVVFDKTGTLSGSHPVIACVEVFADDVTAGRALQLAAALDRDSGHPLAAAFVGDTNAIDGTQALNASGVETVAGSGVRGRVEGVRYELGQARFVCNMDGDGSVWLGRDGRAQARFEIHESARPEAVDAVDALRAQQLALHIASGDAPGAVQRLASALGIAGVHWRQTPEDKLLLVRALQARGRVVLMVGDGLNDAPVLAGADVSIAIGTGADLARQSADLVLMRDDLECIPQAISIARRCRSIVRQNLAWSLGYNLLAIPLAAAGWVTPWVAATGMAVSSLLVTGNALRLSRRSRR